MDSHKGSVIFFVISRLIVPWRALSPVVVPAISSAFREKCGYCLPKGGKYTHFFLVIFVVAILMLWEDVGIFFIGEENTHIFLILSCRESLHFQGGMLLFFYICEENKHIPLVNSYKYGI